VEANPVTKEVSVLFNEPKLLKFRFTVFSFVWN